MRPEKRDTHNRDPHIMTTTDIAPTGQYTTTEACGILGVHRTTIYRYVRRGVLRCSYRRGNGRPFFKGSELIRFAKATF